MFSGPTPHPFFRLFLLATVLLGVPSVRAIQVEQNDGVKIEARRVTFDGSKFTLLTAAGKVTVPAQQVRYLDADESRTSQVQDTVTKKEGEVTELKSEIARLTTLVEEERKKTEEARKETETYRKSLMQPQQAPTPDPAQQAELTRLQNENARLTTENTQALEKTGKLQQQIAQMQKEKAKPAMDASNRPTFTFQPFTCNAGKAAGLTLAQGTLTNPTSESFGLVVIEVTASDKGGKILDTVNTFVTQLEPNTTRPVRASLEVAPDKIAQVKAVVVDVFKEAPQPETEKKASPSPLKKEEQKGDTSKPVSGQ
ncbi:MAG TPA: FxLYD domain-containing protein [Candidatus Sumerlaeota bacterium]|nr:FxLYD domain-containing protein [Candidatus Sumerlaeota bacterium]